ncbi:MAG: PsbP-related protein [Psychroflexus sp.]|nr:PsbP-related protein [Psychroflexus sp.]MDR9448071.1 PsbP-related protein [Psychroflexus sp.]
MRTFFLSIMLLTTALLSAQNFKTFEKENVSLQHPAEWEIVDVDKKAKDNPDNPMLQSVLLEIKSDKNSNNSKGVEVVKIDMAGKNATLSQMQEYFEKMYKSMQGKVTILKKDAGEANGYEYKSMTLKVDDADASQLGVQRVILEDEYVYVISVSAPMAEFGNFKPTVDQILDSFQVN